VAEEPSLLRCIGRAGRSRTEETGSTDALAHSLQTAERHGDGLRVERLVATGGSGEIEGVHQRVHGDEAAEHLRQRHRPRRSGHFDREVTSHALFETGFGQVPSVNDVVIGSDGLVVIGETIEVVGHVHHNVTSRPVFAGGLISPSIGGSGLDAGVKGVGETGDLINDCLHSGTVAKARVTLILMTTEQIRLTRYSHGAG
jgi:hypothetical protein